MKLDGKKEQVQGDVEKMFKTNNRYRNVLVSPDTTKIYVATDNGGNAMGKDGKPITEMDNKGASSSSNIREIRRTNKETHFPQKFHMM